MSNNNPSWPRDAREYQAGARQCETSGVPSQDGDDAVTSPMPWKPTSLHQPIPKRQFVHYQNLDCKALGIIPRTGSHISKKDFHWLRSKFDALDRDSNARVTFDEFRASLIEEEKFMYLLDAADGMFRSVDRNRDGTLTFGELLHAYFPACSEADVQAALKKYRKPAEETRAADASVIEEERCLTAEEREELRALFDLWDRNKDGVISLEELRHSCRNVGVDESVIDGWFATYDANGDNELQFEEAAALLQETYGL